MHIMERAKLGEHERVLFARDEAAGYHGIVAIHSTVLGPAVGGTRFWSYASEGAALTDALRLSRGMTYKNALANLPLGGGKSIIIGGGVKQSAAQRANLFRLHGRFVESLQGCYITAVDVGTTPADLAHVREETAHVTCLPTGLGDPSPMTARGVFRAMQAAAKIRWGSDTLAGRTVALQGCGQVGYALACELRRAGARLIATDTDADRLSRVCVELGAEVVPPPMIYSVEADIFAPCALGGVINDETIPQLKVEIVAGAANNQLLAPAHGDALAARGIFYAPDYAANAGGVITGCIDLLGWTRERAAAKVDEIYDTMLDLARLAQAQGLPTHEAADRLARQRLERKAVVTNQ